jgi:hypothetical protein
MPSVAFEEIQQDPLALSVARAVAVANDTAVANGTDPATCLVDITEELTPGGRLWRVHYGPRDFVRRRGGDLIVIVEESSGTVRQVLRGQ